MVVKSKKSWNKFSDKHKTLAQFLVFFVLSNGITVLQLVLMPLFKKMFSMTSLVDINFQIWHAGTNFDGSPRYRPGYKLFCPTQHNV